MESLLVLNIKSSNFKIMLTPLPKFIMQYKHKIHRYILLGVTIYYAFKCSNKRDTILCLFCALEKLNFLYTFHFLICTIKEIKSTDSKSSLKSYNHNLPEINSSLCLLNCSKKNSHNTDTC